MVSEHNQAKRRTLPTIQIAIDTIDDIYSDFDLRSIKVRSLSTDFIEEIIQQYKSNFNKKSPSRPKIEITALKSSAKELCRENQLITKERIRDYFDTKAQECRHEAIQAWSVTITLLLFGVIAFFAIGMLDLSDTLHRLLELLCWFSTWEGVNRIIASMNNKKKFDYEKITAADIVFTFVDNF